MSSQFGFLSRLTFLQDWVSALIARVNPAVVHNVEKYHCIKKVHYLSAIENVEGDYLEFGVFTGSSFCHSIRCCRRLAYLNPKMLKTKFFGFDSFCGFGELDAADKHPFYTDENFETSVKHVRKRAEKAAGKDITIKLVPGFFDDSLATGALSLGITKARIIFIDSDTYSSADQALQFCAPTIQEGTFIILDDYYSYKGSINKGVAKAYAEFVEANRIVARQVFAYGMGGVAFVVARTNQLEK